MKELKNLFKDKNFIVFTLVSFIFFILFYEYLDNNIKCEIYNTISNPIIVVILIGLIGIILKYNFTMGIMLALSFVIIITLKPCNKKTTKTTKTTKTNNTNNKIHSSFNNTNIEGFKNKTFLEKTITNITNSLQEGIQENKKLENSLNNISSENETSDKSSKNNSNSNSKSKSNNNSNKLEIPKRKFELDKRDDKVLIYSKEVLKDIINRINYEYDDRDYLKKYIGNKFEEIIDLLGLLDN